VDLLVTGGAGFIGSHVVRALVARGDAVRVLDDLSSGSRSNLRGVEAQLIEGDIADAAAVRTAMAGVTHVIHLAALVSVPRSIAEPILSNAVNVVGTLNVLTAARDLAIRRVVLASSSAVYGDVGEGVNHEEMPLHPTSPYGVDKAADEMYASVFHGAFGLETVALRYFNVFGPRQDPTSGYAAAVPKFVSALLDSRAPVIFGDGQQTRDFTYVANVVHANLLALEAPHAAGQSINVATGVSVDVNTLAHELAAAVGRPNVRAVHVEPRLGDIRHSSASIQRAREVLGFAPVVDLRDGLTRTVRWYGDRAADEPDGAPD
jgi:nucleoside-diphosphate-sugar epimerase